MTYQELNSELLSALDYLNEMQSIQRLLVIASKENDFTRDNFENIHLLLEIYQNRAKNYLEELDYIIKKSRKIVKTETKNSLTVTSN